MSRYVDLVRRTLPQIPLRRVWPVGEGWANFVLDVNDEWIFRFPRTSGDSRRMETEIRLLAELEKRFPLPVPHVEYLVRSNRERILFIGYRKLRGRFLPSKKLSGKQAQIWASELGRALRALRRFPRNTGRRLGIRWCETTDGMDRWRWLYPRIRRRIHPMLPRQLRSADRNYWDSYLRDLIRRTMPPELNHGDLFPHHILVDDQGITGVLDWEDACYEDPVGNVTGLPIADGFADRVVQGYLGDKEVEVASRLAFHRHAVPAYSILYGLDNREPRRVRQALADYAKTLPP